MEERETLTFEERRARIHAWLDDPVNLLALEDYLADHFAGVYGVELQRCAPLPTPAREDD